LHEQKVGFLVPIYPPHFHYGRDLLASLCRFGLDTQSDFWFVFTNCEEKAEFGEYEYSVVLPENLRIFENYGIINIKKLYGLKQIQDKYEYIIVLDAESLFIKTVDLYSICKEYFDSKILLGNEILTEYLERAEHIKSSCKRYFSEYKDFSKLNNPLYLWFNQPCIYKTDTLTDFWDKIRYEENIKNLQWADFDYYLYMFYLILFQGFRIEDIGIKSNYGICEADEDFLYFKSDKYKTLTILIASPPILYKFDNPKCFITIHLDRGKDQLTSAVMQNVDSFERFIPPVASIRPPQRCITYCDNISGKYFNDAQPPIEKNISFVIQGELNRETIALTISSVRRYFPCAELVLATYVGSDIDGLDYDKITLVEDPGFYPYDSSSDSKPNNINRQIRTTLSGLKAAARKYVFKLRSDFILNGCSFLDFWGKFPKSDYDYKVFEKKVLSCVFFARNPRVENPLSFHPSDIAFFGLRTDLINLFDVPFMTEKDSTYYKLRNLTCCRYTPEQHLWVECLRKNGKKIKFDHQRDTSNKIAEDTEKFAVSNFIYLDWNQFSLTPPIHLTKFAINDFAACITHIEWQKLYKHYLDGVLKMPKHDALRKLIDNGYKRIRRYEMIARILTLPFRTKLLKKFKCRLRKKIAQQWTENLCLPR
jgi:hypothetical protein